MSDEQIIYISPEDDVTSIRERMDHVQSKHVTLLVPANTKVRSPLNWNLLYRHARKLGKEVLIVSSDPQIRSVAHAVKFKVADSKESASSSKSRPVSRGGRTGAGTRGKSSGGTTQRTPPGKGAAEGRGTRGSGEMRPPQEEQIDQVSSWYSPGFAGSERPAVRQDPESKRSQAEDSITGGFGSTFDMPEKQYGPTYDYRLNTSPPIQPLSREQLDEEPDLLMEDFNQARAIEQANLSGSKGGIVPTTPDADEIFPADAGRSARGLRQPTSSDDPFGAMEDALPPPALQEQRGSALVQGFDSSEHAVQDISEMPTDIIESEIEYGGGAEAFAPGSMPSTPSGPYHSGHSWVEPTPEDEQDMAGPARNYVVRPHSSRQGNGGSGTPGSAPLQHEFEEDALPPTVPEERPAWVSPPGPLQMPPQRMTGRPSRDLSAAASNRSVSQPLVPRARPTPTGPTTSQNMPRTGAGQTPRDASATSRPRRPIARRGGIRPVAILITAIILLVLLIGSLAYFGPSADVTLTLPSRTYAHELNLVAQPGLTVPGVVSAQVKTKTFSQSGTLTATGSKQVGNAAATGSITFTNNGKQPVTVPTNTLVTTRTGVQFATDAELVVNIPNSPAGNSIPVPVHAVVKGESGNVLAGSITVIPPESLSALATASNVAISALSLKVSNDAATTGGGVGNAHAVQKSDRDAAQIDLHNQLQKEIDLWVNRWSTTGVHGNPTSSDMLVNPPQDGQIVDDPNVPITLNESVSVLYVSNEDLQNAAAIQLNNLMSKDASYHDEKVNPDAQHPVKLDQIKAPGGDLKAMTLSYNATAQVIPNVTPELVRGLITGVPVANAVTTLAALRFGGQRLGEQNVVIKVSPSFVPWVPFWTPHINVKLVPGPTR